ncbi:MAG TPA: MFS transporter [Bacilli bacterium]|nr:MFS transporter [Bacilli bacterium]
MLAFLRSHPLFLRFWMSMWSSELGDWIRNMTLMYMVLDLSDGSGVAVSINMFCEFAPIFLFAPLVGVFADRWRRKVTIIGAFWFRALMVIEFILALHYESLLMIYIGAFLCAIGTLFFRAPGNAFTMQMVEPENRKTAATLRQISTSSLALIGAPLGTLLFSWVGGEVALGATVVLFLIGSLLVTSIRVEEPASQAQRGVQAVLNDLKSGFVFTAQHPILRPLMISMLFCALGAGVVNVLSVFVITEYLGLPQEWYSMIATIQGAGMLVASLSLGKIKISTERMVPYGLMLIGSGLFVMVVVPMIFTTAAGLLILAIGQILLNIGVATLMQTKVDYAYQGRVSMIGSMTFNGGLVTAMLLSGWLHETIAVQTMFRGGGALILFAGVMALMLMMRAFQMTEKQEQATVKG